MRYRITIAVEQIDDSMVSCGSFSVTRDHDCPANPRFRPDALMNALEATLHALLEEA